MRRLALLLGVPLWLFMGSAVAQNCAGFTDVPSSSPFCPDVTWITNYGITKGCAPSEYCPNDNVTRLQMAAFLHRLGKDPAFVNGGNAFGAAAVLGTSDDNTLTINVFGQQAMMVQPVVDTYWGFNPNVVNGPNINVVFPSVVGGTIAGGGGCNEGTGGTCNEATQYNQVTGSFGTVGGGATNAAGYFGTVPGGYGNVATGNFSVASGYLAQATHTNSFVWSGWSGIGAPSNGPNQFFIGADHGFSVDYHTQQPDGKGTRFFYIGDLSSGNTINVWNGAVLTDGGTWTNASDRALKEDFIAIDAQAVLAKVAQLSIDEWRYKSEHGQRHLGPVAQDFYAAFGLGADDRHITTVDEGGVALAAIKGLYEQLQVRDQQIAALRAELDAIKAALNLR
jgi:hypothetical protein